VWVVVFYGKIEVTVIFHLKSLSNQRVPHLIRGRVGLINGNKGGQVVLATLCWVRKHRVHRLSRFGSPFMIIVAG